jgi:ribosome-binding factor A
VANALTCVLASEDAFRGTLVRQLGFSLKDVRVSPDHAKAYVLWDSVNGRAAGAAAELERRGPRLRAAVARALGARAAPALEFRLDRLSAEGEALDRVFSALDEERREGEGEGAALGGEGVGAGAGDGGEAAPGGRAPG